MGHKGPVLRPRCIGPGRILTQIPFLHSFGTTSLSHPLGSSLDFLTGEDGTDILCRNVGTYKSTLHQILEERRSYLQRDGSQKSRFSVVPDSGEFLPLAIINTVSICIMIQENGRIVITHNVQFAYTTVAFCYTWCIQMRQSRFHCGKSSAVSLQITFNETVPVFTASNEFSRFFAVWALIMDRSVQ